MTQEPRKATDVILDLESKLDTLLGVIQTMDLNIKVLSNKLNEIMKNQEKLAAVPQKITVEAVQQPIVVSSQAAALFGTSPGADPEKTVVVTAESKLPADDTPQGFRRTSRPDSYAGDTYLKKEGVPPPRNQTVPPNTNAPKPPPGRSAGDSVSSQPPPPKNKTATPKQEVVSGMETHGIIPVEQRVVDRNGKSVFLADVEIMDLDSGEQVYKSRTNGTGKWQAPLPVGNYKVVIKKLESLTREKIESVQTIRVDGIEPTLKLPMVIIK